MKQELGRFVWFPGEVAMVFYVGVGPVLIFPEFPSFATQDVVLQCVQSAALSMGRTSPRKDNPSERSTGRFSQTEP